MRVCRRVNVELVGLRVLYTRYHNDSKPSYGGASAVRAPDFRPSISRDPPFRAAMSKHAETTTSHRAVLTETAGEPARPVCVLRSDVPGLGNIQLTRERSTVVIGRSRSVDYRIDHPQARRSNRPFLTHRNSPRGPPLRPSLRVAVHS